MNVYHLGRHFDCVCNVDLWHCAAKQMITGWHFDPAGCSQPNKILCSNRCNQFSSVRPDYLGVCYAAKLDFSFLCVDLAWLHVMGRPRASTGQDDRITFFTWNGCSNVQYIHLPHISEMMQQVRSPMWSMCRGVVKWSCFTYVPPWTSIREPVIQLNIIFSSLFLVFVVVDRFFFFSPFLTCVVCSRTWSVVFCFDFEVLHSLYSVHCEQTERPSKKPDWNRERMHTICPTLCWVVQLLLSNSHSLLNDSSQFFNRVCCMPAMYDLIQFHIFVCTFSTIFVL